MWNPYADEKIRQAERDLARLQALKPRMAPPARRGIAAPVARFAGRRVRRLGEALEAWAAPPPAREDAAG